MKPGSHHCGAGRGSSRLGLLAATLLLALGSTASQADKPATPHIVVGIDISENSPYVTDKEFAEKAAAKIAPLIRGLPMRSKVTLRTVGSYQFSKHSIEIDREISRLSPGKNVAGIVTQVMGAVPGLVSSGKLVAHRQSNIVAFLTNISRTVDCSAEKVTIILASDGFEQSEYTNLKDKAGTLPTPEGQPFKDCVELQILGLGQGQSSPRTTERLHGQWEKWAQAAGFKSFIGLNDW